MRIEQITISGFGRLADRQYDFPQGRAALVIEDNEAGKSTLAAAILAGLCGFPSRKRSGEPMKLAEVYRPWDGGPYAVTLRIEAGGRHYIVERDFDRGSFAIRDTETNRDLSAQFDTDLARSFLSIDYEDLQRLAFVGGKQVQQFSASTQLQNRLAAVVEGSQDEAGAAPALAALQAARFVFDGREVALDTALRRVASAEADVSGRIARLEESLDAAGADVTRLDDARAGRQQFAEEIALLEKEFRAARLRELREKIDAGRCAGEEVSRLESELDSLQEYASFPAERGPRLSEAVGRLDSRKTSVAELQSRQERLREQIDRLAVQVAARPAFADATEADLRRLRALSTEIATCREMRDRKASEIDSEARALRAEGIEVDRALSSREKFDALPPADRDFVRQWPETEARVQAETNAARAASMEAQSGLQEIARKRAGASQPGKIAAAVGIAVVAAAVATWAAGAVSAVGAAAGVVLGIVAAAVGAVLLSRATSLGADRRAELERAVSEAAGMAESLAEESRRDLTRLQGIATQVGCAEAGAAVEELRGCEIALDRARPLAALQGHVQAADEALEEAQKRAVLALAAYGVKCESGDAAELDGTIEKLADHLAKTARLVDLQADDGGLDRDLATARRAVEEEEGVIRDILRDAGLDPELPPDRAVERFGEKQAAYARYRELRDSAIEEARRRVPSAEQMRQWQSDEANLAGQVDEAAPTHARPLGEVDTLLRGRRADLEAVTSTEREIQDRVGYLVDQYRRSYPELREQQQRLQHERDRAERFQRAVDTAASVLRDVSEESQRRWALALNMRASAILPKLNPGCTAVHFDEKMGVTITTSTGRVLEPGEVNARLSTGARDQVYLAVRLACCAELCAAGETMPVVLDDPLIAADDTRFFSGMRYLACEFAQTTQVIILSCHRSRHEALRRDPEIVHCLEVIDLDPEERQ